MGARPSRYVLPMSRDDVFNLPVLVAAILVLAAYAHWITASPRRRAPPIA